MTAAVTKKCVDNSNPLGRRYNIRCSEHGLLNLRPVDAETARDLERRHAALHTDLLRVVGGAL